MFVVAASDSQPGPPPPPPRETARPVWRHITTELVGIQHAAAVRLDGVAPHLARCGASLTGWTIFEDRPFDLGAGASCRRCAQLLSGAGPR